MTEGLLERLERGPVLGDGGYLLELEKRGYVQAGPFTPEVSITNPEALAELHREFLRAGAEVLQALTFYASEEKLATVGLAGRVDDINQAAVRVARSVARRATRSWRAIFRSHGRTTRQSPHRPTGFERSSTASSTFRWPRGSISSSARPSASSERR